MRINETLGVNASSCHGIQKGSGNGTCGVFISFLLCTSVMKWDGPGLSRSGSQHCSAGLTFCCWQSTKGKFTFVKSTPLEFRPFCDLFVFIPPPLRAWPCGKPRFVKGRTKLNHSVKELGTWGRGRGGRWQYTVTVSYKHKISSYFGIRFYIWTSLPGASSWTKNVRIPQERTDDFFF